MCERIDVPSLQRCLVETFCSAAWELFLDWGVKIMRATFRGVHKSVINDNKNTVLDLVSEYNIIMM